MTATKRGRKPKPAPRFEYRVRYRRMFWVNTQARLYQRAWPARLLMVKLCRYDFELAPIVELTLQRRKVGPWVDVEVVVEAKDTEDDE